MTLDIAFSPCPNDTIIYHAWVHGLVEGAPKVDYHLGDIEELNQWAIHSRYPLSKVSFGCLPLLLDRYCVLSAGAALGFGCGPKLVAKKPFSTEELHKKSVAVPGEHTTAKLLLDTLIPTCKQQKYCLYNEVTDQILSGEVDAGVIIHETRFCFEEMGLVEIADLGELWEMTYKVPVPLGCLVADRSLGTDKITKLNNAVRASLMMAQANPLLSKEFIHRHAQEMDPNVIDAHIDLYVNDNSLDLSPSCRAGITELLRCAGYSKQGIFHEEPHHLCN